MSSVTDSEATINAFTNAIRPSFNYFVVNTAFSACLFTLFLVLLALSTNESRRRLVFRLNLLAICLVLTMGALMGLTTGKAVVDPFNQVSTGVFVTGITFLVFPPLLYDSILLTRLLALYPPSSTAAATLVKILAFPLCIKCARVVIITIGLRSYIGSGMTTEALVQDEPAIWFRNPYLIAEWTMQIVDNMYSVSLFLYNLHIRTSSIKRARSIADRIRQIFYISVANFIFPLVLNIAQIIFAATDRSPFTGGVLPLINNYVTVMGVLCATLWFSGSEWVRTCSEPLPEHMLNSPKPNVGGPVTGGKSGSTIQSIGKDPVTHDTNGLENGTDPKQLHLGEKE